MAKVNTIANNGLTIVENYNKLLEQFRKTKTIDDVRILVASVRDFISVYKRVDKNMVNEIYEKLQGKLQDMVAENAFVYDRMNNRVEEIRNRGYDYANEQDDTQAVQSKALQLMSQMPKVMNSNHANRITKVLTDSINSGVIGSKAVLELLKYPAYADMVSAKIRERAFEGSKSSAEQAFDRLKESELKEAEQGLASVYMQGFHLRNIEKQVNAWVTIIRVRNWLRILHIRSISQQHPNNKNEKRRSMPWIWKIN